MIVALIVSFAFFMQQLDGTVIATALPQMAATFGAAPVTVSIGITAYLLTLAVFIPTSSWVADRFGSRTIFGAAIVVFTLGSVCCGFSDTLWQFVLARILQAIGGALMLPVGRLAVLRGAEKHELLHLTQFITIPGLVAPVIGPALGGFISTYASWRWIFYLNVPIGLIGLALALIFMRNYRAPERRAFDVTGFLLSGVGLSSLMYGFTLLSEERAAWYLIAGFVIAGAVLVWLAVRHAGRHATPLVELTPLRIPTFAASTITGGALLRLTIGATPFLWPLMFQLGFGMTAFLSGLLVMACTAGDFISAMLARAVVRVVGIRRLLVFGGVLSTAFILACALFTAQTPVIAIVVVLAAIGVIRSLQFTSIGSLAYSDVPAEQMSAASTLLSTLQQLTMGMGVAFGAFALNSIAFVRGGAGNGPDTTDFRLAFIAVATAGACATLVFARLPANAGANMIKRSA